MVIESLLSSYFSTNQSDSLRKRNNMMQFLSMIDHHTHPQIHNTSALHVYITLQLQMTQHVGSIPGPSKPENRTDLMVLIADQRSVGVGSHKQKKKKNYQRFKFKEGPPWILGRSMINHIPLDHMTYNSMCFSQRQRYRKNPRTPLPFHNGQLTWVGPTNQILPNF